MKRIERTSRNEFLSFERGLGFGETLFTDEMSRINEIKYLEYKINQLVEAVNTLIDNQERGNHR